MSKPVFSNIIQIGVVVRDAEETARHYRDLLGLDDWQINYVDTKAGLGSNFHHETQPIDAKSKIAWMNIGNVELELIEPQDEDSAYARFLRVKGPGIHHVMFSTPDYDECVKSMADHQIDMIGGGELQHTRFQMFDTENMLSLICEIADGDPLVPDHSGLG